jgi:hypothetical protein
VSLSVPTRALCCCCGTRGNSPDRCPNPPGGIHESAVCTSRRPLLNKIGSWGARGRAGP